MDKSVLLLMALLKGLEKFEWRADPDAAVSAKADKTVRAYKSVPIKVKFEKEWQDEVETTMDVALDTDDEITFFPKVVLFANLQIGAIPPEEIQYEVVTDAAISTLDLEGEAVENIAKSARQINTIICSYVNKAYYMYCEKNKDGIKFYQQQIKEFRTP